MNKLKYISGKASVLALTVIVVLTSFLLGKSFTAPIKADAGSCKVENAECQVNNSNKACCEDLTCVPFNTSSGNGKCRAAQYTPAPTCEDTDGDGVCNEDDNCPAVANPDQADSNDNGIGDACDSDSGTPTPTPAPIRSDFNLTSMCKPSAEEGSLRIRNNSSEAQEYSLTRYGDSSDTYSGMVDVGDTLKTVNWYSSSDTWILEIAGYSFTKAIGNNPLCESPTPTPTATPTPTNTTTVVYSGNGDGLGCATHDCSGNSTQGQVLGASTQGQVLGASTMAGTGSFDSVLYQAIMGLGGIITSFGLKKALRKN